MNAQAKHVTGAKAMTPQAIVQTELDKAGPGNLAAAQASLEGMASAIPAFGAYIITLGVTAAIGEVIRSDNAKIYSGRPDAGISTWRPNTAGIEAARQRAQGAGVRNMGALLRATLPNRVVVADATRADLLDAITRLERPGANMMRKAQYFKSMLARLPDGKRCGEVFTQSELERLFKASERGDWVVAA